MPQKKPTQKKPNTAAPAKSAPKKSVKPQAKPSKTAAPSSAPEKEQKLPSQRVINQLIPCLLFVLALFIMVCIIWKSAAGIVGGWVGNLLFGLFGAGAYAVPVYILILALFWRHDIDRGAVGYKVLFSVLFQLFLAAMLQLWTDGSDTFSLKTLWSDGIALTGGGALGGLLGQALVKSVGKIGTHIIGIAALVIFGLFMFGLTPYSIWLYASYYFHKRKEKKREQRLNNPPQPYFNKPQVYPENNATAAEELRDRGKKRIFHLPDTDDTPEDTSRNKRFVPDVEVGDGLPYEPEPAEKDAPKEMPAQNAPENVTIDEKVFDSVLKENAAKAAAGEVTDGSADSPEELTDSTGGLHKVFETFDENIPPFDLDDADYAKMEKIKPESVPSRRTMVKQPSPEGIVTPEMKRGRLDLGQIFTEEDGGRKTAKNDIFSDPDGVDVLSRFTEAQREKERERQEKLKRELTGEIDVNTSAELELSVSRSEAVPSPVGAAPVNPGVSVGAPLNPKVPAPPAAKTDGAKTDAARPYIFPPISMLKLDTTPKNTDISEELHTNAVKLVETLNSFKVRTRIVNVSRGPTITRYELAPEEGIRVRAIANLVDDIALNLATSGVRIEAPIPGKAAVGIEVPNKDVATVYLRELIDTAKFRSAPSRLNVVLGDDVAGEPIFLDIAKMPHLLISGATGMGKSVCINSMLVSLLYKATPDEVKLILIDPKKVELNIYNGLPHLIVPVVSDPKKAAGALSWAVNEMERRFELIESVGVRDLKNYNSVTKDDPEKEFLPQIVIVIDELADLMMTAPDDVETSICRLAQKARAAGMHLIIGTQHPTVNVITGLIKANIPSRIAFTVSSSTESRVILDMGGADKLIGRGDMLYAPVGAQKPVRVQGAFVSETEIESIVEFIKKQKTGVYSDEVMASIEKAAAACGSKKGSASGSLDDDGDAGSDPMLKAAVELAVESGKISTSLIQRRLSLGYGRAAKLIDEMEQRGLVSAPDGQKPREVLISKEQYMEMVLRNDE